MGRDPKHDYKGRCIYHITLAKAPGCPDFCHISGTPDQPLVERSAIGLIIETHILNFPILHPSLQILQYIIMPDHIHFAIFAREYLPRALGSYIGMMKVKCGQCIRASFPAVRDVFTPDFHDRYLRPNHSLRTVIEYIRLNPARLLARRFNPDFFRKINNIPIDGKLWQAYGNLQLLQNPFKGPVVIHRRDSPALREAKYRRWRHLSENGGVLVSPFISADEKDVRRRCEETGGKVILLTNEPFGDRQKPSAHDFGLCTKGLLLILAPMRPLPPGRRTFLYLNHIAALLSSGPPAP
ncbi:MAG: hypothetical protein K2N09_08090 [Muribaculaceae bacterium]|nr:hypothetical protein [Muribaculaceae bacterium]